LQGLQDIYYAEKTLSKTLPNMKNASTPQLATLTNHLKDTNEQISIGKIFEVTGIKPTEEKHCNGRNKREQ
jgi:ferritin-like metal-binding protein YciE